MKQTEVHITKSRKYYDVKLRMHTFYGYRLQSLYQKFLTSDQAMRYAENVANQNDYKLIR